MLVPDVRRNRPALGVSPTACNLPCGLPPLAYSWWYRVPSRSISIRNRSTGLDDADAYGRQGRPTPCTLVPSELAPVVQHGEDHLDGALALVRAARIGVDRDATPVVVDPAAAIGLQRDVDAGAVPGHRLVDRVVDHLPDQVVQSGETGGPDIHARALANGIEPFEDLDVLRVVISGYFAAAFR